MIRHLRVYRVLRIGLALARVLPRYWWLLARHRLGRRPPTDADWTRAHAAAAREIRRVALALAGATTKVAQVAGARADVLPAPFIDELSRFHDAVPPRPFDDLVPVIEADLGRSLDAVFARVERDALAAASLAQVHRARLTTGEEVVVKVQYPEIRRIIPLDLRMARAVAGLVQRMQGRLDVRSVVGEVTRFIELEIDFEREARSTQRLRETLVDCPEVRVPHVYMDLCGPNVLVLEYLAGIQVTRTHALVTAGHRLPDVARRIGALYGAMIFGHDFFHGDPHPGNLLVLPDGRIGLLDFGLCKELPPGFARLLAQMMVSAMIGDSPAAMEAAAKLGFDTERIGAEQLRTLMLMTLGDRDTEDGALAVLGQVRIRRIPEDFALVVRTLILLNGLSHRLTPGRRVIQGELLKHLARGAAQAGDGKDEGGRSGARQASA